MSFAENPNRANTDNQIHRGHRGRKKVIDPVINSLVPGKYKCAPTGAGVSGALPSTDRCIALACGGFGGR